MRTFTVRRGNYSGEHVIYDSIKEATEARVVDIKAPWYGDNVETGSWVVSDDGYVIQCLRRDIMVNPKHRSGQYTDTFRFCNGTFGVYHNKQGNIIIPNFYAVAAKSNKGSIGSGTKLGVYMNTKKKLFCSLVSKGENLEIAYIHAFKPRYWTKSSIYSAINRLLEDERVKEELMEKLRPFKEKVEKRIKEKAGYEDMTELLVAKITELITDKNVSHKDLRADLTFMLQLFGKELGIEVNNNKLISSSRSNQMKEAEEAEFQLISPPELGGSIGNYKYNIKLHSNRVSNMDFNFNPL